MKNKLSILLLVTSTLLIGCNSKPEKNKEEKKDEEEQTVEVTPAIKINKQDGKMYNIMGEIPAKYVNTIDDPDTLNDEVAEFMYANQNQKASPTNQVQLSWNFEGEITFPVSLKIYSDENLTNLITSYNIPKRTKKTLTIVNPIPSSKWYYQLTDSSKTPITSEIDSISFDSSVRTIYTAGQVSNMRDLGGWKTVDGSSINYGLIYRCASMAGLADDGKEVLVDALNIKNEIDVRLNSSTREHPIEDINFVNYGVTDTYQNMTSDSATKENIKSIFEFLANKDNYPLVYHCSAGADRTGFVSLLVEGALGVNNDSIFKDYELTTFYLEKRLRSNIIFSEGNYNYDPTGKFTGFYSANYSFISIINKGLKNYFNGSTNICDAVYNFLTQDCLVKEETIFAIKEILLKK